MATHTAVPVEEYLRTTYHPDMEYVGGELVERHVGEFFHSRLQSLIVMLLGARESDLGFMKLTEQRVKVSNEPRYRIPDVCAKAIPFDVTPILTCPDLVIEILSPDDETGEMLTKIGDYLAAGIPHIWVIDPHKRTVLEADPKGIRKSRTGVLSTELVGEVDFGELFQRLDKVTRR